MKQLFSLNLRLAMTKSIYKIEKICDGAIYIKQSKIHLPEIYYIIL